MQVHAAVASLRTQNYLNCKTPATGPEQSEDPKKYAMEIGAIHSYQ